MEDENDEIIEGLSVAQPPVAMFESGGSVMATCWVPLLAIFACMAYYDLNPFFFFMLAGLATAYIHLFLPELSGSAAATAAAAAAAAAVPPAAGGGVPVA